MDQSTQPISPPAAQPPAAELTFQQLFRASARKQDLCMLAVLAWIAACDGVVAPLERELLVTVAEAGGAKDALPAVMELARLGRPADLEIACRYLRNNTTRGVKRLLARLAVTMAVQDGHVTIGENLVLQFLADLLGIGPRAFARLFEEVSHRPFPVPGDPSDPSWWHLRETGGHSEAGLEAWDRRVGSRRAMPVQSTFGLSPAGVALSDAADAGDDPEPMTRSEALRVLGLDAEVPHDAIHAAYRRLAKARHPDHFARLGPAAVTTATFAFERLNEAYALLSAPGPSATQVM